MTYKTEDYVRGTFKESPPHTPFKPFYPHFIHKKNKLVHNINYVVVFVILLSLNYYLLQEYEYLNSVV